MSKSPRSLDLDKSIAVLPFVNMSADPANEYFSDGITEEIINTLTKDQGLKVIARTSSFAFKGKNIDIRTIGAQLGVSTVLEGSVRKVQNRVRITAQLINTIDGTHIWSKNFDRELEDIFALQDEISLLIADQIRENFGHFTIPDPPTAAPTQNIEAYEMLLKGSYFLKRKDFDDVKQALGFFQKAVALDPNYAEAHAFIGETYLHYGGFGLISPVDSHAKARVAAKKAVSLNEREARAHKVLAYVHLFYDWDWEAAISEYRLALQCGLPDQNEFITYYYIFLQKDYEKAIEVSKQVLETDPLHIITHWQLGLCYYFAGRFEQALRAFDHALLLDANFGEAHRWRGLVLGYLGRFEEALTAIHKALDLAKGEGPAQMDLLIVKVLMGKKEEVIHAIKSTNYLDPIDPAMLYTLLEMPDEAIFWLEKGYEERSVMMVTLKHFWLWDKIRADARFQKIYAKMKFTSHRHYAQTAAQAVKTSSTSAESPPLLDPDEVQRYGLSLSQYMKEDQLYLDPSLSLRQLAEHLGLHPNKLSWLLNEHIGKNFNEYINFFRLETFKVKALEPANSHLTLLGLAYESGFNSKTVFNAYFKRMEDMTPSAWVKSQRIP